MTSRSSRPQCYGRCGIGTVITRTQLKNTQPAEGEKEIMWGSNSVGSFINDEDRWVVDIALWSCGAGMTMYQGRRSALRKALPTEVNTVIRDGHRSSSKHNKRAMPWSRIGGLLR